MTLDGKEVTLTELDEAKANLTKMNEAGKPQKIIEVSPGVFKTMQQLNG